MGLKVLPIALRKSLSTASSVVKEMFPKLDPEYRNMMKSAKASKLSASNPLYKTVSAADVQQETKMKNLATDKFIKAKMP